MLKSLFIPYLHIGLGRNELRMETTISLSSAQWGVRLIHFSLWDAQTLFFISTKCEVFLVYGAKVF